MKNLCKSLMIALVIGSCGAAFASKADAQAIVQTDYTILPPAPAVDANPVVLSEPAIIDTTQVVPPAVLSAPEVINSGPFIMPGYIYGFRRHHHLRRMGIPGLINFSLF